MYFQIIGCVALKLTTIGQREVTIICSKEMTGISVEF